MGFFSPVDFVASKAEESSRMAQYAHGLICSRFFKLHHIVDLIEKGFELIMNWMGYVATSVVGPRLLSLSENRSGPLIECQINENTELVVWIVFWNFLSEIDRYCSALYYRWLKILMVKLKEMKCRVILLVYAT